MIKENEALHKLKEHICRNMKFGKVRPELTIHKGEIVQARVSFGDVEHNFITTGADVQTLNTR